MLTGYGVWETGECGMVVAGTTGGFTYLPANNTGAEQLIYWANSPSMNVGGNGFWRTANNRGWIYQLNAAGTTYHALFYLNTIDQLVLGVNSFTGDQLDCLTRGIVLNPRTAASVSAPAVSGQSTLFVDSADGLLKRRLSNGTLKTVTET
jgi:hypothetical protein